MHSDDAISRWPCYHGLRVKALMNPLDWLLAILLTYSVIRAAMRGFFREAFALGGLVVGFILACWNFRNLALQLRGLVTSPPLSELLAFILILAACMVIATLLGKLLSKTASAVGLGFLDRLGGAAFGLARGALLGIAILLMMTAFLPASPWVQTSFLAPYFLRANHAVSFVMPYDLQLRLSGGLEHIRNTKVFGNKNLF
jgi:membrane protein required for colicin V production